MNIFQGVSRPTQTTPYLDLDSELNPIQSSVAKPWNINLKQSPELEKPFISRMRPVKTIVQPS